MNMSGFRSDYQKNLNRHKSIVDGAVVYPYTVYSVVRVWLSYIELSGTFSKTHHMRKILPKSYFHFDADFPKVRPISFKISGTIKSKTETDSV
mgnify:CR=1 FL=1